mmetsp:Transcript_7291/g.22212  ORF Transcript_7291/g.22212 Transcript_7291/m.22212 type:complete len:175 (+) Transcript_7291:80-604(+)|eukprot:CAMPEP_0198727970 /NCGR_PEP_ID=MMETSP1475-20131203/6649_1 /TAXON_ID= ORGANISM="Unidentified sp., Strain CCMP1999" /NCGR_SAMPLE_ID=MMETSP1475 /ASSEMBLY_ACC=CAM_ASM_001111 /LENGTH=174 /DNA_ID=CAMNT_0044490201 /DNA_START=52 /DNA_END=576 /DNA_ORIENTATION=-
MGGEAERFLYFAYGSNLNRNRLHINCPSAALQCKGSLGGYKLAFTHPSDRWKGASADILPEAHAVVHGAVWSIDRSELPALDRQEGVHYSAYRRISVVVASDNNTCLPCFTYTVVSPSVGLNPSVLYMRVILHGANTIGLPETYIEQLLRHDTFEYDDDTEYQRALEMKSSAFS